MTDDTDDKAKKVVQLFGAAARRDTPAGATSISNAGGVVVNGAIHGTVNVNVSTPRRPRPRFLPPPGSVDARQKFELQQLVDAIVKDSGRTHAFVWTAFKRRFQVNSYHELPEERFDDAHEYLRQWRGAANNGRG